MYAGVVSFGNSSPQKACGDTDRFCRDDVDVDTITYVEDLMGRHLRELDHFVESIEGGFALFDIIAADLMGKPAKRDVDLRQDFVHFLRLQIGK